MDHRVEKVIELMASAGFDCKLSLSELAHSVGLSPSRLTHLFKVETGLAPRDYFKLLRMQQAKELLETSTLRVKEIAVLIGMDESHFVRDFQQSYGLSPARYRAHSSRTKTQLDEAKVAELANTLSLL